MKWCNARYPLITPTYEGSGEAVHPSVIDSFQVLGNGAKWNGYRYWMALTPFPSKQVHRSRYENPSILASDDGVNWTSPSRVTNPIIPPPTQGFLRRLLRYMSRKASIRNHSYNADPALCLTSDGVMYLVYIRYLDMTNCYEMLYTTSIDGWRTHSNPQVILSTMDEGNVHAILSPSLLYERGRFTLYYGYIPHDGNGEPNYNQAGLRRRVGTSLDKLEVFETVKIIGPVGKRIWHHEVRQAPDERLYCLASFGPFGTLGWPLEMDYYFGTFLDEETLLFANEPILARTANGWDAGRMYRASFTFQEGEKGLIARVWYSAQEGSGTGAWHIGYTEGPINIK